MINIFVDTNRIEAIKRTEGEKHYNLNANVFSQDFRDLVKFVVDKKLQKHVKILVPEIVCQEMLRHYYESFKVQKELLLKVKETAGNICKIKIDDEYNLTVDQLKENLKKEYADIEFPTFNMSTETFQKIVKKAINKEAPFRQHSSGKDVGFKDVLIWETVLNKEQPDRDLFILYTKDGDFDELAKTLESRSSLKIFNDFTKLKKYVDDELFSTLLLDKMTIESEANKTSANDKLIEKMSAEELSKLDKETDEEISKYIKYGDSPEDRIWDLFISNEYLIETVLEMAGLKIDDPIVEVKEVNALVDREGVNEGSFVVYVTISDKEKKHKLKVYYDYAATEVEQVDVDDEDEGGGE